MIKINYNIAFDSKFTLLIHFDFGKDFDAFNKEIKLDINKL